MYIKAVSISEVIERLKTVVKKNMFKQYTQLELKEGTFLNTFLVFIYTLKYFFRGDSFTTYT